VWPYHQRCRQGGTYLLTSSESGPGRRLRSVDGVEGFERGSTRWTSSRPTSCTSAW